MYSIEITDAHGTVRARAQGEADARLVYRAAYQPGDIIRFAAPDAYCTAWTDQAVAPAHVYLPEGSFTFQIPFGDAARGYAPAAFQGDVHTLWIGPQPPALRTGRHTLSCNPAAQRAPSGCFPFASANVETRGEAQFWARNAIDGARFNDLHGGWPYHSWGIGERRDAWLRVDFGRPVLVDEVALVLRADFPHDAWWQRGTLELSDGFTAELPLVKTAEVQSFPIGEHEVTWLILRDLVKADDPSPFPALTQLEAYGRNL